MKAVLKNGLVALAVSAVLASGSPAPAQTVPDWQFSWTLLMLEGTLLLSAVAWLGPTIWLGLRPTATDKEGR